MIADRTEADFEGAGNLMLAFAFFEHGKNLRAKLGGMPGERLEGDWKFGRNGAFRHKDCGIVDQFRDWARP